MHAVVDRVFYDKGIRFIFSTRSKVPFILKPDGSKYFDASYKFEPGKDEVILEGTAGYVVSFGEMLYRSYDAVLRAKESGLDVGLINKPTLNLVDEKVCHVDMGMDIKLTRIIGHLKNRPNTLRSRSREPEPEDWCMHCSLMKSERPSDISHTAGLQIRYLASRERPNASLRLHGYHQGRMRRSLGANPPSRLGSSV
jgi:hypothetical protein